MMTKQQADIMKYLNKHITIEDVFKVCNIQTELIAPDTLRYYCPFHESLERSLSVIRIQENSAYCYDCQKERYPCYFYHDYQGRDYNRDDWDKTIEDLARIFTIDLSSFNTMIDELQNPVI